MSTTIVQSLLQAAALYNSCNWMIYWTSLIQLTFVMSPNVIYNFLSSNNEKGSRFLYMYVIIIKIKGKFNQFWGFFSYSLVGLNLHSPPPPPTTKKPEKRKHQVTTTVIHYSKISMKKNLKFNNFSCECLRRFHNSFKLNTIVILSKCYQLHNSLQSR